MRTTCQPTCKFDPSSASAATTDMCCRCAMRFSVATSAVKAEGSMNSASNAAPIAARGRILHNECCVNPAVKVDAEFRYGISVCNDLTSCRILSNYD